MGRSRTVTVLCKFWVCANAICLRQCAVECDQFVSMKCGGFNFMQRALLSIIYQNGVRGNQKIYSICAAGSSPFKYRRDGCYRIVESIPQTCVDSLSLYHVFCIFLHMMSRHVYKIVRGSVRDAVGSLRVGTSRYTRLLRSRCTRVAAFLYLIGYFGIFAAY
jgi:hypothetical protein